MLVGLPRTLAGREGRPSDGRRRRPADPPVPVRLVDERLTTVVAERQLRAGGRRGRRPRPARVVDLAAAVGILQPWLDRVPLDGTALDGTASAQAGRPDATQA